MRSKQIENIGGAPKAYPCLKKYYPTTGGILIVDFISPGSGVLVCSKDSRIVINEGDTYDYWAEEKYTDVTPEDMKLISPRMRSYTEK